MQAIAVVYVGAARVEVQGMTSRSWSIPGEFPCAPRSIGTPT